MIWKTPTGPLAASGTAEYDKFLCYALRVAGYGLSEENFINSENDSFKIS